MENIVRTIRAYYPVSDEALAALTHGFEKQVFPAKTLIIRAGQFDQASPLHREGNDTLVHLARWKRNNDMVLYGR